MKLTQIRLSGFKSFADSTVIRVPGRLVGVVGPNGCGKSNVIDAVRWVLGESSAKQLRGENMQDVIFNGAATRPAASRASVELVFDNADNALSGEWGRFSEIAVKRSLNRKGESAYFINNQQVRRRDITDLFLGTGVGARGYAVIEQGMISRIIEAKPEELRGYIEEAAGVSKYKERRRETESRLKDSLENLARLSDIKAELEKQVEKLKRQAAAAERYRKIKADLDLSRNRLDFLIWTNAQQQKEKFTQEVNELEQKITELDTQHADFNEKIYALQLEEYNAREKENELSRQAAFIREEIARLEEQIRHHLSLQQRREKEQLLAKTESEQISQRLERLLQDIENTQILIDEKRLTAEESRLNCAHFAEQLPQNRVELEKVQQTFNQSQIKINQLKQDIAIKKHSLERNNAEMLRLQSRLPEHDLAHSLEEDFCLQEQKVEELQLRYDTMTDELSALDAKLFDTQAKITKNNHEKQSLNLRLAALDAEFSALSNIENDSNQCFWDNFPHLENRAMWKNLHIQSEWQQAVSSVLGERLTARYAPDLSLDFSNSKHLNTTAVWINQEIDHNDFKVSERNMQLFDNIDEQGFRQPERLIEKITAEPPFSHVIGHWLDGIWCVENLSTALQYQAWLPENHSFVTPEGHQISRIGVSLFGGNDSEQLLQRQNRLNELNEEKNLLLPKIDALELNSGSLNNELEQINQNMVEMKKLNQNILAQLQQEQNHFIRIKTEFQAQQKRRVEKEKEQQETQQQMDLLNTDNQRLTDEIEQYIEELTILEDENFILEEQVDRLKIKFNQSQEKIIEMERSANQAELALKEVEQQFNSLHNEENHLKNRLSVLDKKQQELALENDDDENDNEENQKQKLNQLEQKYEEINELLNQVQQTQNQRRQALEEVRQKADSVNKNLPEQQKQREMAVLKVQQAQLIAEQHQERLLERNADLAALENDKHNLSENELNQQVKDFSNKLNNMGAVNLAALEELQDAETRQNELSTQYEDIENAVSQLKEAVAKIDAESRQLFKATFDAANHNMQKYFPVLFGGGEAALTLTDNDLLSAGVSIMARPPGKKNSTIYLLSGGEKALTAMSLVFSLFSLNPAPFCLLDEVDAPLDDANTARFCQLVQQMSDKTQFLYISHNRLTMENAEQLIGVTMQEKGVSRIVSVDIQAALKMAEQ
ncbi:MAG: chromosome segregation protein SMC [Neisseriaceae bacterium]|nr:chromosome segregation protein SMC [Neisseriaceae bacterium]